MDWRALLGEVDKFGKDYPGLVAVAALAASVVVPIGWDLLKGQIAKAQSRPRPKTGRLAGVIYAIGRWFRMMGKRLITDSESLAADNLELSNQNTSLSSGLRAVQKELTQVRAQAVARKQSNNALTDDLAAEKAETERLGKEILRARGTDHKANQESFALLRPVPVPQPVWLIKKAIRDGYLDFQNVGGGKATAVSVDTNYPIDATLVDAYFDAVGTKFTSTFAIEPPRVREEPDLEYTVSWVDESGKHQTTTKKAAER
ncbi:hypothetical protein [Arthrobacter sp. Y81]|uniref:hypothetical protein n=1 Tax=Arthrobacter sp. Y81 TaxID=2058897 RepID=UPI000CE4A5D8|nr:hypothetical protein [Arthrobacter sp. Y81]